MRDEQFVFDLVVACVCMSLAIIYFIRYLKDQAQMRNLLNSSLAQIYISQQRDEKIRNEKAEAAWEEYISQLEDPAFLYEMSRDEIDESISIITMHLNYIQHQHPFTQDAEKIKRIFAIQQQLQFMLKPI